MPALLIVLGCLSIAAASVGPLWTQNQQREREAELLRIGVLYAQALKRYHDASPGSDRRYPQALDELLLDSRFAGIKRHMRRLYTDPIRPGRPWELIRDSQGGIRGVYSGSESSPWTQKPLELTGMRLPVARQYRDWRFVASEAS
jgi:type II secretory pathway pseudopilin PulG